MNKEYIDKVAWICLKDKKILSTRSIGKETWYIPGGKREAGESDQQALVREIKEELSVNLKIGSIKLFGIFTAQAHGKAEGMKVRMTCYMAEYDGELAPAAEIERFGWLAYADKNQSSAVDQIIFEDLKEKGLIL